VANIYSNQDASFKWGGLSDVVDWALKNHEPVIVVGQRLQKAPSDTSKRQGFDTKWDNRFQENLKLD
jgi:hypothetical protein